MRTNTYRAPVGNEHDSPGISLTALKIIWALHLLKGRQSREEQVGLMLAFTLIFPTTCSNHEGSVLSNSGRAPWIKLFGPINLLPHTAMPRLISSATLRGSYSATQPNRHPGSKNRFESPDRVRTGTEVEREAIGMKGASHVCGHIKTGNSQRFLL